MLARTAQGAEFDQSDKVACRGRRRRAPDGLIIMGTQPAFEAVGAFDEHPQQGPLLPIVDSPVKPVERAGLGGQETDFGERAVLCLQNNLAEPAQPRVNLQTAAALLKGFIIILAVSVNRGGQSGQRRRIQSLCEAGFATSLLDLLTPSEEKDRVKVFDISLLARRLLHATDWAATTTELAALPIGYFGANTGAGAALLAAAIAPDRVRALVSRGGRPDLAGETILSRVHAPTLLIVGSRDAPVTMLNREVMRHLRCASELVIVPNAGHLFEEPGTLDAVIGHAQR